MKIETPENANYVATVVSLPATRRILPNLDNVQGVTIFGYEVLVGKDTASGLGIFFPAETQLSDEYLYENSLYRHGNLNKIPDAKGYFEDNRRVRAIKFKGNSSNGIFMPLSSLSYTGIDINDLKEGDNFDKLNGKEICKKFTVARKEQKGQSEVDRGFVRADKLYMPEHIDTENFYRNADRLDKKSIAIVTQKLHGTSVRIANTMVNRKPSFVERIASFFGATIAKTEYANLYGSRKVIKDANNPNQNHYYDSDIWTTEGKKLDGILPENYILYGELLGWTPEGKEIQRDYTYSIPKGNVELYVYRIAIVNPRGLITDLSWQQVKEFCYKNGLKYTPELFVTSIEELVDDDFKMVKGLMDIRYFDGVTKDGVLHTSKFLNTLSLGTNKDLVDEGICIRIDGLVPQIFKAKSPKFLEHETMILDTGEEDLESSQSTDYKPIDL